MSYLFDQMLDLALFCSIMIAYEKGGFANRIIFNYVVMWHKLVELNAMNFTDYKMSDKKKAKQNFYDPTICGIQFNFHCI